VGPTALSAGTLEEGLVLNPAIATFAKTDSSRAARPAVAAGSIGASVHVKDGAVHTPFAAKPMMSAL
jgi:hypothetical protein